MNFFQWIRKPKTHKITSHSETVTSTMIEEKKTTLERTIEEFKNCSDLIHRTFPDLNVSIIYFGHMVGSKELERDVIMPLLTAHAGEIDCLLERTQYVKTDNMKSVIKGILDGEVALFHENQCFLVDVYGPEARAIEQSEIESTIIGPHDAFVETSGTNLSLIRRRIKSSYLKTIKLSVGELSKTDVYLLYVENIANPALVKELQQRIENVEMDAIQDTSILVQCIEEHPNSVFPQFITTERPDVAASKLADGKIVGVIDGSPIVFSAPSGFFEFLQSPDDYTQRWLLGSFIRLLRFLALIIAVSFTALYVAITTYHYEMIPENMLMTLGESRSKVPLPPIYEALLLEITIELLREAGARLPTKIGQTIGIVGGIVIGQAIVQAGFTSNILIIAVAISTLSSFAIPSYMMSDSIRLLRFGLLLLAGFLGHFGLVAGIAFIVIHLSGLTNLGTPYLLPAAPFYLSDWKDTLIRGPFWVMKHRSSQSKFPNKTQNKMKQ